MGIDLSAAAQWRNYRDIATAEQTRLGHPMPHACYDPALSELGAGVPLGLLGVLDGRTLESVRQLLRRVYRPLAYGLGLTDADVEAAIGALPRLPLMERYPLPLLLRLNDHMRGFLVARRYARDGRRWRGWQDCDGMEW